MNIEEIKVTASLARLELVDRESEALAVEITRMLAYFEKMNEIPVDGLEPTTHALITGNRCRPDGIASLTAVKTDDMLECAPDIDDRFIIIPNVL
jgi:aspartyl-tRNA(Asn)/glutamyl-tRNA(Gln) amidotransferase subunit C